MSTEGLDQAATAFDVAMGNAEPPTRKDGAGEEGPIETMFGRLGQLDEDSPPVGGGDDEPDPEPKIVRKAKKPQRQSEEEPEDDEDDLFNLFEGDEDPDEGQDDEEDGEDEEGGEEGDEDDLESQKFSVVVDGEETEVTLKEALDGYIRQETFHRRMNRVSEAEKQLSSYASEIVKQRDALIAAYEQLEEQAKAVMPEEPDWDKLFNEDPKKAYTLRKHWDEVKAKLGELSQKREQAMKERQEAYDAQIAEFAKSEFPKFAEKAKWRTKKDMERDVQSMRRTALSLGFTEEEVAQVYDHRMLTILLKASKYDRIMASRPKPVKNGSKGKGAGSNRTAPKALNRAQKTLAKTGSLEAAAGVFKRLI